MKCMTHCGEDVDYQREEFPNGFYVVPRNIDQSIHLCEKLHDDDETIHSVQLMHADIEFDNDLLSFMYEFQHEILPLNDEEIKKNKKFAKKILNYLFFLNNHICSDPYLESLNIDLSYDTTSDLTYLSIISKIYELQNDFESAIKCEILKHQIDGSTSKNILELYRKDRENYLNEDSHSVAAIRDKLRIVENEMTNLIRTKIDETKLEQFFPIAYAQAVKDRKKNHSDYPEKKDLLDWMTFGSLHSVLGNWSKNAPKELQFNIQKITYRLTELNDMRNRNDHHKKPQPLDEFMSENERMIKSLMCDECIEYLKDQISKAT